MINIIKISEKAGIRNGDKGTSRKQNILTKQEKVKSPKRICIVLGTGR